MSPRLLKLVKVAFIFFAASYITNSHASARFDVDDYISRLTKGEFTIQRVCKTETHRDRTGYLQVETGYAIDPMALDNIFSARERDVEILEIGPGDAHFLKKILTDNRAAETPVRYTAVEESPQHCQSIRDVWRTRTGTHARSWGGISPKKFEDYYATKTSEKLGKFDIIYAGYYLHVLTPVDYIRELEFIFNLLKPGGTLYLTQQTNPEDLSAEEFQIKLRRGDLLPFWGARRFVSDPVATERVFTTFGFDVTHCQYYADQDDADAPTTAIDYIALVAQKPVEDKREASAIQPYRAFAEKINLDFAIKHMMQLPGIAKLLALQPDLIAVLSASKKNEASAATAQ